MLSSQHGPFVDDLQLATLKNDDYRRVLYTVDRTPTTNGAQLVLMKLEPGDEIGMEQHDGIDQFIHIVSGRGFFHDGSRDKKYRIYDGVAILIPAGTWHNIMNASNKRPMLLYTLYFPAEHPYHRRQHRK